MRTVNTATEFCNILQRRHPSLKGCFPARANILRWFDFPGKNAAAAFPKPTQTWTAQYAARCAINQRKGTGPKPKLAGCDDALAAAAEQMVNLRLLGTPVTTNLTRVVLVTTLKRHGHGDLLSPHLRDKAAARDPSRFLAGQVWPTA